MHRKIAMSDDRLLIEREQAPETVNGLVVPDSAKEKCITGVVIGAGPLSKYEKDEVLVFSKYAGVEIKFDFVKDYIVLRDSDVIGVVNAARGRIGHQKGSKLDDTI